MALIGRKVVCRCLGKKSGLYLKKVLLYQRDSCNGVLLLSLVPFVSLVAVRSLIIPCWKTSWPSGMNISLGSGIGS